MMLFPLFGRMYIATKNGQHRRARGEQGRCARVLAREQRADEHDAEGQNERHREPNLVHRSRGLSAKARLELRRRGRGSGVARGPLESQPASMYTVTVHTQQVSRQRTLMHEQTRI